jgi:predicted amidohydrolase YtcJ
VHALGATAGLRDALVDLELDGRLPLRVKLFLDGELPEAQALLHPPKPLPLHQGEPPPPVAAPAWLRTRLVQVVGVKFWLDGTLGAHTAAMSQPYADDPGQGKLAMTDATLAEHIEAADRAGLQVALHAIGDAAVAQIVRVISGLHRAEDALPVRIEHAQVVAPDTLAQLATLRVVCSVQPLHARDDVGVFPQRLGPERLEWGYRLASLAKVCPLLAGSDLPVSDAEPLAMWQAMTQAPGRAASERMDAELALRALLPGGTATGQAVPQVGDRVDLVVWSRDPLQPGPPPEVLVLVVAGQPTVLTLNDRGDQD